MSYTVAELDDAVETWHEDLDDADYDSPWDELAERIYVWRYGSQEKDPVLTLPGIGEVRRVDRFGGEGQGDGYWLIAKVTDADGDVRLFRRNGFYASYDGGYFEGPTDEVAEAQQTITVYNKL